MPIHVQAHRGARAAKPENTLPAFELALDLGVDSIEMDLWLTRDDVVVVFHDDVIGPRLCRAVAPYRLPQGIEARIGRLEFASLNQVIVDRPLLLQPRLRIPPTPLALQFMKQGGRHEYGIPTLTEVLEFVREYASTPGEEAGKTTSQREKATLVRLDLELKGYGRDDGQLERSVLDEVIRQDMTSRVCIRSFDHRHLVRVKEHTPQIRTGALLASTRPVDVVHLMRSCAAEEFFPEQHLLDAALMEEMRQAGIPVIPWTVNDEEGWRRLIDLGVTGITTDYPRELLHWLQQFSLGS